MNDKKDVALQLALEVLTQADADTEREPFEHVSQEAADAHYKLRAAIAAIRAALAEPQGREWWAAVICPPDGVAFLGTELYPTRQAAMAMPTPNRYPIIDAVRLA